MPGSDDIIVIGHPEQTVSGIVTVGTGPGGPGGGGPETLIRENQLLAASSVAVDPDASDQEIIVTGQRLKSVVLNVLMQLTPRANTPITLPCIGDQAANKIRAIVGGLKFQVKTKDYGPGRAGANLATASTTNIPVEINKDALKGYDLLPGGLNYIALHEMAHSFKAMRDFNQAQFGAFRNRVGKDLPLDDLKAQFPSSPEFAENEARANSIAKALGDLLNGTSFSFDPKHGFSTSC